MTKQIELSGKTCLLVTVIAAPNPYVKDGHLLYGSKRWGMFSIKLPPGNWRKVGKGRADSITESEWKEIVEEFYYPLSADIMGYKNYIDMDLLFDAPTESGHSLRSCNGFKKESTVILVKE